MLKHGAKSFSDDKTLWKSSCCGKRIMGYLAGGGWNGWMNEGNIVISSSFGFMLLKRCLILI